MNDVSTPAVESVRLDDRINPILVKEVRQALRGKYFKVLFWLTLCVGTLIGLSIVSSAASGESSDDVGRMFFMVIFGALSAAVHGFVPFSAYLSTAAEWDENTYDLLVISNLRPRQIVLGKLLSALIQALLYYSTFGPFLVFAFLMNGIDLMSVLVILVCSMATCIALTLVGIAASSLTPSKVGRVVVMAIFGAGLLIAWGVCLGFAGGITFSPEELRDPEGQIAVAAYLSAMALIGLLGTAIAMARFAHEEENRSTPLRVLSTAVVLVSVLWSMWMYWLFSQIEVVWGCQVVAVIACFLMAMFFQTEPEELGRRVEKHMPRSNAFNLMMTPFYPGGGRGVLLHFVHLAIAIGGTQLALSLGTATSSQHVNTLIVVATLWGYSFLYTALPSGIASFFARTAAARTLVRFVILIGVPVSIFLPVLIGLFFGIRSWTRFEHPFQPFLVLSRIDRSNDRGSLFMSLAVIAVLCVLTLILNLPRLIRGVQEVATVNQRRVKFESETSGATAP